ncbi:hypothetical protein [Chromobacterium amazonense]|uniref:Uncharacterized protein n=1 Tax=Chromobacterium amazonense TaxID=1382803 RepID=A0A1S1WTE6_9NEIS|nr:hypothetical protein [Chromobacterium amazonense]KIA81350.1 hypothetical protein QR66_05270 [Chromobacterium piscinae]MBM2885680.1 hypothetical protein [Chromobacterium amazonense]MDE1713951.1 hypothetical protein [Chromobacterium amazonense]OHX10559.1 hypothetical protein BI343_06175 [Chromobacterium amazonense]PRP72434.1 hypothetical protein BUE93_01485 [Chromobacterium amazonense]
MKYLYSGPISGVTLADGQEIMLFPGKEVEMPEDHNYTRTLVALGYLNPQPVSVAGVATSFHTAEQGA